MEYLWEQVLARNVDWIVSDHACCASELKWDAAHPADIWLAKAGFGGTEYLLPGLLGEGRRRGLSYNRVAELTSANPARRYGLLRKGDITEGYDADLALVDPDASFVVRAADSESGQGYTPFEGQELHARVRETWLRGERICEDGTVLGVKWARTPPGGRTLNNQPQYEIAAYRLQKMFLDPPHYVVPPTVMRLMRSVGCPVPTGTDWPSLPQVPTPGSSFMSLPTMRTRVSTSGPLPISVAPLTGAPILPSSMR